MKLKMLEHFSGSGVPTLDKGKEYELGEVSKELFGWLIEHKKAVEIIDVKFTKQVEAYKYTEEVAPPVAVEPIEEKIFKAVPKKKTSKKGRGKVAK